MKIAEFVDHGTNILGSISDSPKLDCEILLLSVLEKDRGYLYTWPERELSEDELQQTQQLLQLRQQGKPVAYILGRRDFWDFTVEVTPATLIPRPETELLVEFALQRFAPEDKLNIADLGTGSGILGIALAREFAKSQVCAVDFSEDALAVARRNANSLQVNNIEFYAGSWFAPISSEKFSFDLIVSNPPYIEEDDLHLHQGDVRFEPNSALASGIDGLDDIRIIAAQSSRYLKLGGVLAVEHGYQQGEAVRGIFESAGLCQIETIKDLQEHDRVTIGQMSG